MPIVLHKPCPHNIVGWSVSSLGLLSKPQMNQSQNPLIAAKQPHPQSYLIAILMQAPAVTIGDVGSALLSDGCTQPFMQEMARVDKNHSERNAHRLFNRYGLALKVPLSTLQVLKSAEDDDPLSLPYLGIRDYVHALINKNKYEQVLLGGLKVGPKAEALCSTFWSRYRFTNPDHVVFQVPEQERQRYIPILLHGDKGRTLQKAPIFVMSWETPFGLDPQLLKSCSYDCKSYLRKQFADGKLKWSCSERVQNSGTKRKYEAMHECTMQSSPGCPGGSKLNQKLPDSHQRHNSKGHSYVSRWLISAIPSKIYNRNANALRSLLKQAASELTGLFKDGILHEASGTRFHFAFIGVKGDAEFHWEAGEFNRSYHNTGLKRELMICHQCEAGAPNLSFTDCRDTPQWAATIGTSEPWDVLPPLNHVPYATSNPASLYLFDPFHVLKYGVFRDCIASVVVRLCGMTYFDYEHSDLIGIEWRLERAYAMYQLWAAASGKNPTLKKFTKANFNFEKYNKFAWVNCKGSESTLLLMWLSWQLQMILASPKEEWHVHPLQAMKQMVEAALTFIGVMHSHGLWLPRSCSQLLVDSGLSFLRGYNFLAQHCIDCRVTGFRLRPKLHYLGHIVFDQQMQLRRGAQFTLSPAIALCEQNEDFIGRLSRVSRRVSARTCSERTIQRYLVKVRLLLEKMFGK